MIKIGAGNLNEVFEELEREKGISKEVVISSLCDAMVAAYKKHLRIKEIENVEAFLDEQSGETYAVLTQHSTVLPGVPAKKRSEF